MIGVMRQSFFCFFKLLSVLAFLLLVTDLLYRYDSFLHYANHLQIWKTAAFLWLLMVPIVAVLAGIVSLPAILIKFFNTVDADLKAAIEIVCASFFAVLFILYDKELFTKGFLLGEWIFVIILVVPLIIVLLFMRNREAFRQGINNIIRICWIPSMVLFLASLVWIGPGNINFSVFYEDKPSKHSVIHNDDPLASNLVELSGRSKSKDTGDPDIILVTFDALSARDMSLYGYRRKTTPFWEELAEESDVFENFHSNATFTEPSMLSVLTSKYPWTHGVYRKGSLEKEQARQTIPALLRDYNYLTVAICGPHSALSVHPLNLGLSDQFDLALQAPGPPKVTTYFESVVLITKQLASPVKSNIVELWLKGIYYDVHHSALSILVKDDQLKETAELNLTEGLKVLKGHKDSPIFLWIHINPPHLPYWPPPPFKGTYLSKYIDLKIQTSGVPDFNKVSRKKRKGYAEMLRARYDEMILYTDTHLCTFVKELKKLGVYENTILILTADHGETFEKGYACTHGSPHIYEPEAHIPLLIHLPGQQQGRRVSTLAEGVDLAPTILDILGKPIPSWMEGESLLPYMRGDSAGTNKPKFCMNLEGNYKGQPIDTGTIAVYYGDYKMVRRLNFVKERLYKIRKDPLEQYNIIQREPDTTTLLRGFMYNKLSLSPVLFEEDYKGFNVILYGDTCYGLAHDEGGFYIDKVNNKKYKRCFAGDFIDEVKRIIDESLTLEMKAKGK